MKKTLPIIILIMSGIMTYANSVSFTFENDVFVRTPHGHSDDDYSNGVRLEYLDDDKWGVALGQSMYTPRDIVSEIEQYDCRPFAGYLYLEGNYRRTRSEFGAIQLGFVGDKSLAEETQRYIHKWIGARNPSWFKAIDGHFVEAEAYYKKMFYLYESKYFYLCPTLSGSAGTVNTKVNPGIHGYLGLNYKPGYYNGLEVTEIRGDKVKSFIDNFSIWLFAGTECDCIAYDYFLDAPESNVDKKNFVLESTVGAAVRCYDFEIKFAYLFKTREYDEQRDCANFGSLTLSYIW